MHAKARGQEEQAYAEVRLLFEADVSTGGVFKSHSKLECESAHAKQLQCLISSDSPKS